MSQVTCVGIRIREAKLIGLVLTIECKGKAQNVMILMLRRFIVKHLSAGYSLPFRSTAAFHKGRHSIAKEIFALGNVDDVEYHPLVDSDIVDGEIEPEPQAWTTGVWPNEKVVFEFRDEVYSAKVPRFERGVETKMSFLRLSTVTRWTYHQFIHVPQSSLCLAVLALRLVVRHIESGRTRATLSACDARDSGSKKLLATFGQLAGFLGFVKSIK